MCLWKITHICMWSDKFPFNRGGVLLTVYGEHLDSAQTALLLVNMVRNTSTSLTEQQLRSVSGHTLNDKK